METPISITKYVDFKQQEVGSVKDVALMCSRGKQVGKGNLPQHGKPFSTEPSFFADISPRDDDLDGASDGFRWL